MIKIGIIAMVLALVAFLNAGWFVNLFDDTPTPPVEVPIDVTKAGNTAEIEVRISSEWSYLLSLEIRCVSSKEIGVADCNKAMKIAGINGYEPHNGKQYVFGTYHRAKLHMGDMVDKTYNFDGTVIPIRLSVYKIEENKYHKLIREQNYETKGHNSTSKGYTRNFASMSLDKGRYLIVAENLKSFPELEGRDIGFSIYSTRRFK